MRAGSPDLRATATVLLAALVLAAVLLGPLPAGAQTKRGEGPDPELLADGARLYQTGCASCHGQEGEGGLGPSLVGVGAASAHFQLSTGRMPLLNPDMQAVRKPPAYNSDQIEALVAFVASLGDGPPIPEVDFAGTNLSTGQRLFISNCSPCHGATGNGGATGRGAIAPSLYAAEPVTVAEAIIVGPGQMPKFGFDDHERDSIVRYVSYLQATPSPGGADLGGVGPVPEGFVALGVGVGAIMVIVLFIGRSRSRAPGGQDAK